MDIIFSILKWYGIATLVYGGLWFLSFVVSDLWRLYKNKKSKYNEYSYYFVDEQWQVLVFAGLAFVPIVNVIHFFAMIEFVITTRKGKI